MDRPDGPNGELIRYRMGISFSKIAKEIADSCIPSHCNFLLDIFHQLICLLILHDASGMQKESKSCFSIEYFIIINFQDAMGHSHRLQF